MKETRKVNHNFGSIIAYVRKKKGYSLKEVELKTGISASYIHRLEQSKRDNPTYTIINKLANLYEIEVTELLEISEPAKSSREVKPKVLSKIILTNDFQLAGKNMATQIQKEKIVAILDEIIYCEWRDDVIEEICEIGKLIQEFKAIS